MLNIEKNTPICYRYELINHERADAFQNRVTSDFAVGIFHARDVTLRYKPCLNRLILEWLISFFFFFALSLLHANISN